MAGPTTCRTPAGRSRAPRTSASPARPRRPGPERAGTSFWERVLREVGGRSAEDLVLHLQPPVLSTEPDHLGLLGGRQAVLDAIVDVGLLHPAADGLRRD